MLVGALSLCIMPARPRVQRAPGLPRALFTFGGQTKCKPRAISAARRLVAVIRDQEDWRDWTVHVSDSDDEIFVLPFAFVLGKPH
jgi:hypothetical protein